MGTAITMYSGVVPADNMAAIDVPLNGGLVGVMFSGRCASVGADMFAAFQLSFASASQFTSHDTRSPIATVRHAQEFTTSGVVAESMNIYVPLPEISVNMGERIYIHGVGTAIVWNLNVTVYFDFDLDKVAARRR